MQNAASWGSEIYHYPLLTVRRPLIAYESLQIRGFPALESSVAHKEDSRKRSEYSQYRAKGMVGMESL